MFKKGISVVLQMIFLLLVFGVGSFLPAFGILPMWRTAAGATHWLVWDGLVLMFLVFAIILGIEAARKRIRTSGPLSALALVLAMALGFAMKFGLMDRVAAGM